MTLSISDRVWQLIRDDRQQRESSRGKFVHMAGETRAALQQQRGLRTLPEQIYGIRILINDTLPAGEVRLGPYMSEPR